MPSKLLLEADSFDVMVYDVALNWEKMQHNKQNGVVDSSAYDQKELQNIMQRVKGKWNLK